MAVQSMFLDIDCVHNTFLMLMEHYTGYVVVRRNWISSAWNNILYYIIWTLRRNVQVHLLYMWHIIFPILFWSAMLSLNDYLNVLIFDVTDSVNTC